MNLQILETAKNRPLKIGAFVKLAEPPLQMYLQRRFGSDHFIKVPVHRAFSIRKAPVVENYISNSVSDYPSLFCRREQPV
jgi:hypothetical protein